MALCPFGQLIKTLSVHHKYVDKCGVFAEGEEGFHSVFDGSRAKLFSLAVHCVYIQSVLVLMVYTI